METSRSQKTEKNEYEIKLLPDIIPASERKVREKVNMELDWR